MVRHSQDCQCDACLLRNGGFEEEYASLSLEALDPRVQNLDKAKDMMDFLGIPQHGDAWSHWTEVYAVDLYDILMDDEKLKNLVSKLRNKAFW